MLILDGQGYWIEPASYSVHRPRVRTAQHNRTPASGGAGAGERYVDFGPGKREFRFTVLAYQSIRDYTGTLVTTTGQQYRDALHASYEKVNTVISFTDPHGQSWSVRFDALAESIPDIRSQVDGEIQYLLAVVLVEA
jgi:hypothetical protein